MILSPILGLTWPFSFCCVPDYLLQQYSAVLYVNVRWEDYSTVVETLAIDDNCVNNSGWNWRYQKSSFMKYIIYLQKLMIGCFNHWVVTLVADKLNPKQTLQLTTSVRESLQLQNTMLLWWCSHRCSVVARSWAGFWMLFDTSRYDPFTDVQWLLTARYWL